MIKAILFDVGGTLIEPYPSVGDIYSQVASQFGLIIPGNELNSRFKKIWKEKKGQTQAIDKNWWRSFVEEIFKLNTPTPFEPFFEGLYATFAEPRVWRILPQVKETLTELKKMDLKLAVASNWDSRLPRLLEDLKLAHYFDHQFISFSMNISKPNPQFFRRCLDELGYKSGEVFHIGDDEENDFKSPTQLGIRSFLLTKGKSKTKDHELENIADLISILNKEN